MIPISLKRLAIILITVLIAIQGAAALTIEQAPLNPAFVAYTEEQNSDPVMLFSAGRSIEPDPEEDTEPPYMTGLIPGPSAPVWPDGFTAGTSTEPQPRSFDLRDYNRVTPVRNQGKAGSCWAFATYGSLESTYLNDSGEAMDFSENNMKNLCSDEYTDGFDRTPYKGGFAFTSNAYLVRGSGPVMEEEDRYALPYPSNTSPTNLTPVLDVREVTLLPPRTGPLDNDFYKETLMDEGAIWVSFIMNWSCFADNYTTYYRPGDEYESNGGHAVTLVGWDDDFPADAFAVRPPGKGAFILKNSWGTDAGEDGFFYISYYDPIVGRLVNADDEPYDYTFYNTPGALYTGVPAVEDKHIYQYDPLGWTTSIGTGLNTLMMGLNVFTADRYEEVTDVSFYTREPGTQYVAAVFTGSAPPADDDMPVACISGTTALPGYHTITLPDTVPLTPGEEFSVLLMVSSPTDTYPLVVEMPIEGYSSGATAEPGESYVSIDLANWEDLTSIHGFEDTNVCIKAHTRPVTVVPRDYPTIMAAVNASASGDTIFVESGTYSEALVLNKTVTLSGVGMPVVAIPEDGIGLEIDADNCTISEFSFEGTKGENLAVGISGDDCTLFNTEITGCKFGIYVRDVQGLSLSTIAMHDNTYNLIYWDNCENPGNTIDETVTVNGRPVIYREGVSGETIDASSNAGAVICVNSTDITIRDTTTESIGDGITLLFCQDVCVENVTADRIFSDGVWASSSENITVHDSSFGPYIYQGISAEETNGLKATGNNFAYRYGGSGVSLSGGRDSLITNNTMSGDESCTGVWGNETSGLIVTGNTIEGGTGYGITIINADMNSVSDNTMDVTKYGIHIKNGEQITVSGNTIQCNDMGTGMNISADGAEIVGNTIENCSEQVTMELNNSVVYGNQFSGAEYPEINLPDSGENVFVYRNDFIMTGRHTIADERQNGPVWHSPTAETYWYHRNPFTQVIGNYWSTYNGTDINHDGIGETPFSIHVNETDPFPLAEPISQYLNHATSTPSNGDPSADMATSGALNARESVTLSFTGTAVQTITITAAKETGRILLTVDEAHSGPDGLTGTVYQYLSAQLTGMTDDDISEADFSFRVPTAWMNTEGILPTEITLWRFHDGAWQELPTSIVQEESGWIHYTATTPGFSTFAIATGDGQKVTVTTEPTVSIEDTRTETVEENVSVVSEPSVTVAIPGEKPTANPTEDTTTPQESPLGYITIIGGAAGAALFFRKRD